jgi:hypothetical protein
MNRKMPLPAPVPAIYKAVEELERQYPQRKFTLDGHLVGSIGEVAAAEALELNLYAMSQPGHDAYDSQGPVQIKMTGGKSVAMYSECICLVVLKIISPKKVEIVYDGPGLPAWHAAGKIAKNGQHTISLTKLRHIAAGENNQQTGDSV